MLKNFDLDPIERLLGKLYFPDWDAAVLTLEHAWDIKIPGDTVCMAVVTQGNAFFQIDGDQGPIQITPGDHLISTRGRSARLFARLQSTPNPDPDFRQYESEPNIQPAPDATLMLYAQFSLKRLNTNPLDIGLPDIVHQNHFKHPALGSCRSLLSMLRLTQQQSQRGWRLNVSRLAELILMNTLTAELSNGSEAESPSGAHRMMAAVTDKSVGPVLKALIDQPGAPWTIVSMARMAKISKSAFSDRFRNLVGKPPLIYLTDLRMQKACRLLRDSEIEISNIATLVGYESSSSFSNAFKRWSGSSPAYYRRDDQASDA